MSQDLGDFQDWIDPDGDTEILNLDLASHRTTVTPDAKISEKVTGIQDASIKPKEQPNARSNVTASRSFTLSSALITEYTRGHAGAGRVSRRIQGRSTRANQ